MLLKFCGEKELCVANTWFRKGENRKVSKENRKYLRDVKVIPGEL